MFQRSFYGILTILAVSSLYVCTNFVVSVADLWYHRGQAIVPGAVFDRFITIWLENTDFSAASADREFLFMTLATSHMFTSLFSPFQQILRLWLHRGFS